MMGNSYKELLELAAKAIGMKTTLLPSVVEPNRPYERPWEIEDSEWNPLEDDGDALRLAVKLCMLDENPTFQYYLANEQCRFDSQLAATRRAIVLTAAGIGGLMP